MPNITFIEHDGAEHAVNAPAGRTVMEAARDLGAPGILGDCGGACACATCHVYIEEPWAERTGAPNSMEQAMLEFAEAVRPSSRLGCQIKLSDDLEGLIVRLPPSQG